MAEWEDFRDNKDLDPVMIGIRSLFLAGSITRMYDLVEYSPTKIAGLLGINYNSYHEKLKSPGKFTQLHIMTLAYAANVDPVIIQDIIQQQIREEVKLKVENFIDKKREKKQKRDSSNH